MRTRPVDWRWQSLALVALTFCSFLPALAGELVFDDRVLVENNPLLSGPLGRIWTSADAPDYWPLSYTVFWLERRAFGLATLGYHLVNVALHALTATLLWRVLLRLALPGAWLAGVLFALHPVAVESVAWISELKNVLSGALFAGSFLAYLRHRQGGRGFYWLSLLLFLGALLAKTSTVMLPVALLWVLLYRDRTIARRDLAATAPFFALSALLGAVTVWFQWSRAMSGTTVARGLAERIGGAGWALATYLQQAFLPVNLAFVHPRWPVEPTSPLFWAPLALLAALFATLVALRRGPGRPVLFALGYHALLLLPVLGLVDMAYLVFTPVADHLQYLALMGPVALVAAGLARLAEGRWRVPARAASAALVLALGIGTASRAAAFQDDLRLWERAERDAPQSFVAMMMHANKLGDLGRAEEAIRTFVAGAERFEDPADRHRARSLALLQLRQVDAAVAEAGAARALRPDPAFDFSIADGLVRMGRPSEAAGIFAHVVSAQPRSALCHVALGDALVRSGRVPAGAEEYRVACRTDPGHPGACATFARLYLRLGRADEARREVAAALGAPPDGPEVDAVVGWKAR